MTLRPSPRLAQRLLQSRLSTPPRPPRAQRPSRQHFASFTPFTKRWTSNSTPSPTSTPSHPTPNRSPPHRTLLLATATLSAALLLYTTHPFSLDDTPQLPSYRLAEIRLHDSTSATPWVIHSNKVYDITAWIPAHPGGDVILRAAGGSIDKYWDIFSIHKSQYVYDILESYCIGYVDARDLQADGTVGDEVEDPFDDDPERSSELITRTEKPRNAETPSYALDRNFLTPNDLFYVRNHMWVPRIDSDSHALTVELADGTEKVYTLSDLRDNFPHRNITAVLQCSGNRRANLNVGAQRDSSGLPWEIGAISNAVWTGVSLSDVLHDAGFTTPDVEVKHVHFSGAEAYAASIPIRKATDPHGDVLLAWGMNGQDLPPDHGYPLRCVVPGNVAARSVKWLKKITLSDEEVDSQWQRRDYKCFGPNETEVDWESATAIQEMPVQSAITSVETDKKGVSVGGYAYSGGGRGIVRVDVSVDDGKTWAQAKLLPDGPQDRTDDHGSWSWKRWRFQGQLPSSPRVPGQEELNENKCTNVVVKATDEAYNTQPESYAATWNIRGNCTNAWHRVRVCADCTNTNRAQRGGALRQEPPEGNSRH